MQRLYNAARKVAGLKQTIKAMEQGSATLVYVAKNADERIRQSIVEICQAKDIPLVEADSMKELGKASGIQVGTAAAAVIRH